MQLTHKSRHRRISSVTAIIAALAALGLVASACGSSGGGSETSANNGPTSPAATAGGGGGTEAAGGGENFGKGKTITIPDIGWAEDEAATYLWKNIWESEGFTVKTTSLQAGQIFSGLASGDLDVFFDTWLPVTHKKYWDKYGNDLEKIQLWYDNASLHLTVPAYVKDVNSIADLKTHADMFDGKIVGLEASAGETDQIDNHAIPDYDLEGTITQQTSSTSAMLAALKRAISGKKPIVVALWKPHWAYSAYDLKDLKDPKGSMGKTEKIYVVGHQGFSQKFPKAAAQLKNFTMDDKLLFSLENVVRQADEGHKGEAAQKWMDKHRDFVKKLKTIS